MNVTYSIVLNVFNRYSDVIVPLLMIIVNLQYDIVTVLIILSCTIADLLLVGLHYPGVVADIIIRSY